MSYEWLRLWHDMPNDPKWRTVARISSQRIGDVIAVYNHLLVNASNAPERGRTHNWIDEDVASALDLNTDQVIAIREAMQGRVLDGDHLRGWGARQPKREDNSAERSKAWREEQKRNQPHDPDGERNRTQPNAKKRPDKINTKIKKEGYIWSFDLFWEKYPRKKAKQSALKAYSKAICDGVTHERIMEGLESQLPVLLSTKPEFIPHPTTWLNGARWDDEEKKVATLDELKERFL